jgi:4-hydroxybenzoate polyprenyltransferase
MRMTRLPVRFRDELSFVLKASRPGFWSTTIWFYLLPFAQWDAFSQGAFWLGLAYFTFPFGLLLYGWNDTMDRETDRLNPRKDNLLFGARGTDAQLARLPAIIALVQAPFVALFAALLGPKVLLWFAALLLVNFLYNAPGFAFKGRPPLDLMNQVGYLLVFPLASWLGGVPQLPWQTFVWAALFAMQCHLFGQILDFHPDHRAGRRTTATVLGVRAAKYLLALFLLAESLFLLACFRNPLLAGVFALGAAAFVVDVTLIYRDQVYPLPLARLSALGLNAAAFGSMYWVWSSGCLTHLH